MPICIHIYNMCRYKHSYLRRMPQCIHICNACRDAFIFRIHADMHSYLQYVPQCIHIWNGCRNAFIFTICADIHSYLQCIFALHTDMHSYLQWMPQCIHIASEWNCFLLTLEPPSQQSLPVKTQTGSNLRLASTSDHADKTEVAQILTLLPILSGEYQEDIRRISGEYHEDIWKIPGEYQTGFNLRLASKSDETEVAQILTLF